MASPADPFDGVSDAELRRRLIDAGDRRLDGLSRTAAQEARRDQAILVTELQRRGAPLQEPRPALLPPGRRPLQPEDRCAPAPGRTDPGPGIPF
jgi:hypothetical protein